LLNGSLTAERSFLPQGGLNFKINEHHELFVDAAQNIRAYRGVVKGGASPFDVKQAGFDAIKGDIHPEESFTQEIGWRFRQRALETSITGYHVTFKNRLLAIQQGSAIAGNASLLANVGGVETFGTEGFLAWSPINNVKWSNSLSYNESKYLDDFSSDGVTYHSAGKRVVDAPKIIINSQLAYDDGHAFGHIGTNFLDRRYYSFVNDNYVSSYMLWDLGGGYRWHGIGPANEVTVKFSINNLFDKRYYALGDNPFPASDPNGASYNCISRCATYCISLPSAQNF
jgi:iron complex outermembrane receptor protein